MFMVLVTPGSYEIEEIPAGPETSSCHFVAEDVNFTSNIAALIHTHPYGDGDTINDPRCPKSEANTDEPSDRDMQIVQAIRDNLDLPSIPMYVMDKDKIRIIEPSNPTQYGGAINRCGY